MKLNKGSKIRVLENFYALDYVFFGKPVVRMESSCCPDVLKDYISVKGALMSTIIEMMDLIEFNPQALEERVNVKMLHEMARESAKIARSNCQKMITLDKVRTSIKDEIQESVKSGTVNDIEEAIQIKIREKAFSMAVDNLLIQRTITESSNYKNLNDWGGRIIEDAYKILRDDMTGLAIDLLA